VNIVHALLRVCPSFVSSVQLMVDHEEKLLAMMEQLQYLLHMLFPLEHQLSLGINCCLVSMQLMADREEKLLALMQQPQYVLHFLQPGRLVRVRQDTRSWGWGIMVGVQRQDTLKPSNGSSLMPASAAYIIDVLLPCERDSATSSQGSSRSRMKHVQERFVFPFPPGLGVQAFFRIHQKEY
jgi:hypothetical protein